MPTLGEHANNILQSFGGILPSETLSLEDAANAYLSARAFYWQQLGISDTDITVKSFDLTMTERDEQIQGYLHEVVPAFAQIDDRNEVTKIRIVPLETLHTYNDPAMSFYGSPMRVRTNFDLSGETVIKLYYDPSSVVKNATLETKIAFPVNFQVMVEKKAQLQVCPVIAMKETQNAMMAGRELNAGVLNALKYFAGNLTSEVAQWEEEFKMYRFSGQGDEVYHRRGAGEIDYGSFDRPVIFQNRGGDSKPKTVFINLNGETEYID